VAMPSIGTGLHASGASLQLVVGGFTIAYAMLLITGARLGDRCGRRRVYLIGVITFTFASLACALAPDSRVLVAFRLVQGAGAALLIPQVFSLIQLQFSGQARARALSAYAAVLSAGAVAGLVLGGLLVSANLFGTGWRPVFGVNVPIGIALTWLVPRLVPAGEPRGSGPTHRYEAGQTRRLDLTGLLIAAAAVPRRRLRAGRAERSGRAADASGLLTTTVQLGQLLGVAVIGSVYLSRGSVSGPAAPAVAAGGAMSAAACWLAALCSAGLLAALFMLRAARLSRRSSASNRC